MGSRPKSSPHAISLAPDRSRPLEMGRVGQNELLPTSGSSRITSGISMKPRTSCTRLRIWHDSWADRKAVEVVTAPDMSRERSTRNWATKEITHTRIGIRSRLKSLRTMCQVRFMPRLPSIRRGGTGPG